MSIVESKWTTETNFSPQFKLNFFNLHSGVQTGSTRHVGHLLAYCTCPGWLWGWRIWWNEWKGKPKYSEKTCPDATLSTTNPTWPDPGLNPGRRGGKPTTNRFSYGAAFKLLTSPKGQSHNWESHSRSVVGENIRLFWKPKINWFPYNIPLLDRTL
jgi:hypothetical protein